MKVEATADVAGNSTLSGDTLDVVQPSLPRRLAPQLILANTAESPRIGADRAYRSVFSPTQRHARALRNRLRQHEASVVVGVIPNQVYPTRSTRAMAGGPAEDLFEGAHGTNVNRVRWLLPRGVRENSSQRDKFPHSCCFARKKW